MLDKITEYITNRIRKEMPEIDDDRAEVINFGLQIFFGEFPKFFIMLGIAWLLGIFKTTVLTFFILLLYRGASGGFHLKTHIGCIVTTSTFYCGTAFLASHIVLDDIAKYISIILLGIFGLIMIKLYAPADTEEVPILKKKLRRKKKILSYISFILGLVISAIIKDNVISNIIIFGYLFQTLMITRLAYKITNNRYGYEVYEGTSN